MNGVQTFRQDDSRWGKMYYPRYPYTMAGSACGATACADLIVSNPKYASYTPVEIAKWMINKGYAIPGNGTARNGITNCLKSFGFAVKRHDNMTTFLSELNKGNVIGIILFGGGTRGGVTWTTEGHYVAFSSYKIENGQHKFYMHDPGWRRNDGWFSYETHMRGLLVAMWTATPMKRSTPSTKDINVTYKSLMEMNVRKGASTTYQKVGVVPAGAVLQATKSCGNWVYIPKYNSLSGWICVKDNYTTYLKPISKYTGSWPVLPSRGYFQKGDKGEQVTRIQAFLNWWGNCKLATDGIYGAKTMEAVKKFQKAAKLTADGLWGKNTLAKAKAHMQ